MKKQNKIRNMAIMSCVIFALIFASNFAKMTVQAEESSTVTISHRHVGNGAGGGCYGAPRYCGGRMEERSLNPHGCGISAGGGGCSHCGCWYEAPSAKYPSGCAHCNCPKPKERRCVTCGGGTGGENCSRITEYGVNCGKSEATPCAGLTLTKSTEDWTKELVLEASFQMLDTSLAAPTLPFCWNEGSAVAENTYSVIQNGRYRCCLCLEGPTNAKSVNAALEITNIDRLAPQVRYEEMDEISFTQMQTITLLAEDLQEDGTTGCGLAPTAFSFDDGASWQESNQFQAKQNREYLIKVKDILENTAELSLPITNIDTIPPMMEVTRENDKVTVLAEDLQEDGTEGVGLAELPYSFDGGTTWSEKNFCEIKQEGEHKLLVRDKLGNTTEQSVHVAAKEQPKSPEQPKENPVPVVPEEQTTETISENQVPEQPPVSVEETKVKPREKPQVTLEMEQVSEEDSQEELPGITVKKELVKILEQPQQPVASEQGTIMKINPILVKTITITSIVAAVGSLIFLFLYLWYFTVRIYTKIEKDQYRLIGVALLRRAEEYEITLADDVMERAESRWGQVKFNSFFAKKHKLEPFLVKKGEEKTAYEIRVEIVVKLRG